MRRHALALADREFRTVLRTPAAVALAVAVAAAVVGVAWTGSRASGYVPFVLDALTPLELLAPTLAFAFGYRAVLSDAASGERDAVRTCGVSRSAYVLGVFLGRAAALSVALFSALAVAGVLVSVASAPETTVVATNAAADSPLLYLRFVGLTVAYALVALALAVATSTLVRTSRAALALAATLLLVLVAGFDLALVTALARGSLPPGSLSTALAASPASAYRGLVLELVVRPAGAAEAGPVAAPAASLLSLLAWGTGALAVARNRAWRG